MAKNLLNNKDVTIKLNTGREFKLVRSLEVDIAVNDQFDNILRAHATVASCNLRALLFVMEKALDPASLNKGENIQQIMAEAGYKPFTQGCADFINGMFEETKSDADDVQEDGDDAEAGKTTTNPPNSKKNTTNT